MCIFSIWEKTDQKGTDLLTGTIQTPLVLSLLNIFKTPFIILGGETIQLFSAHQIRGQINLNVFNYKKVLMESNIVKCEYIHVTVINPKIFVS